MAVGSLSKEEQDAFDYMSRQENPDVYVAGLSGISEEKDNDK